MKRLFLASLAVAAALASCTKVSEVDPSLSTNQAISFTPYAGASTARGTAIDGNTAFQSGSFGVTAFNGDTKYYGPDVVSCSGGVWSSTTQRYWPVTDASTSFHFGAYYPSSTTGVTYSYGSGAHSLSFDYTVGAAVTDHVDIMYALTDHTYDPTAATPDTSVGLHFKHAFTQVGFTATKDASIAVTVKSISICNVVDNGKFTATANTNDSGNITTDQDSDAATSAGTAIWTPETAADINTTPTNLQNYVGVMSGDVVVTDATTAVNLTDEDDVMLLLPQTLTKWDPDATTTETEAVIPGTGSFLAIDCVIKHAETGGSTIVDGVIYVPFDTKSIPYTATGDSGKESWLAGYKLTYNLNFGGGYTIPGDETEPKPGEVPNPDEVVTTLVPITYDVTVDSYKIVAGGTVGM